MSSLAVLVPVLQRPHLVAPLAASIRASTAAERAAGWQVRIAFVCSPDDGPELEAVRAAGLEPLIVDWLAGQGDYARKINHAAALAEEEWLFLGADDLRFHAGWLSAALAVHADTGALVVGTNDLGNPTVMRGLHATHSLVHRDYLAAGSVDAPGVLLHEGYDHNCCDVEFVETARRRGAFAFAAGSHVEHLHHLWRKSPVDDVYRKGAHRYAHDRQLLNRRRPLWAAIA